MRSENLLAEIKKIQAPVYAKLREYLPDREPEGFYAMVRDYPDRQGKYFRPALVHFSCAMYGGDPDGAVLTAAAMQASEEWLLVHDDVEDHSRERRSTESEHRPTLNAKHGDELAVNAGDALQIIMWKMLGDNVRALGPELGWKIFDKMADTLLATTEGQYLELSWIRERLLNPGEDGYFSMVKRKTSAYSIITPLQLGAMHAGQGSAELEKIAFWGEPFGYAFQIRDDVLNLTVDSPIQGKEKGGDIIEGKRTLALIHLLEHADDAEQQKISAIYQKKYDEKDSEDVSIILGLMDKYGSIEYASRYARRISLKAMALFNQHASSLKESKAKNLIRSAIEYVAERTR